MEEERRRGSFWRRKVHDGSESTGGREKTVQLCWRKKAIVLERC